MNKKLLALLLAILMVAMSACAMAADNTTDIVEETSVQVGKTFTGAGKPVETFTFSATPEVESDPKIDDVTINVAADVVTELTSSFNVPSAAAYGNTPGKYWYKITEVEPTVPTTGVTYSTKEYYLCVTVYNADTTGSAPEYKTTVAIHPDSKTGTKVEEAAFENTYAAAEFTLTKQIAGLSADTADKFDFTVTFSAPNGESLNSDISVKSSSNVASVTKDDTGYIFTITDIGSTGNVVFGNVPDGAVWTVVEDMQEDSEGNWVAIGSVSGNGYTSSIDHAGTTGTIDVDVTNSLTVTNTFQGEAPDTGVNTDTMPYVLLMALVAIMAVAFVAKKRSVNE